jgi:hypothetical protein
LATGVEDATISARVRGFVRSPLARWSVALLLTLASAVWQRVSGPSYPVRGSVVLGGEKIVLRLARTHAGGGDQRVRVRTPDREVTGGVAWRHHPSPEAWKFLEMKREGDWLVASLPHQPPAGNLEYQVRLSRDDATAVFPPRPAVTRFKGSVPAAVLIPHIVAMFLGMLWSTATGLEALVGKRELRRNAWISLGLLAAGGFLLGPAVQHAAFGEWWTGVPFGWDLTDNKTLLAGAAWIWAVWRLREGRRARGAVLAASLLTLVVFAIPHSVWGSEIRWGEVQAPPQVGALQGERSFFRVEDGELPVGRELPDVGLGLPGVGVESGVRRGIGVRHPLQ